MIKNLKLRLLYSRIWFHTHMAMCAQKEGERLLDESLDCLHDMHKHAMKAEELIDQFEKLEAEP